MAKIAVAPYISTTFSLKIGSDQYEDACSSAKLTPAFSVATWKGGTPQAVFSRPTSPTWTLDLSIAQDWDSAASLSQYCQDHGGETVPVIFVPNAHALLAKQRFRAFYAVVPFVEEGGDIDAFAAAAASWAVLGAPLKGIGTAPTLPTLS